MTFRETFTVALVGADGAGKTTVARMVVETSALPIEYVYMGMNPQANRYALPTSRVSDWLKRRSGAEAAIPEAPNHRDEKPDIGHVARKRGPIFAAARLLNRIVEEWVRQCVVWYKRLKGSIVICDRHFVFDFSAKRLKPSSSKARLSDRIHKWLLANSYPHPELVIFLDAPADVLFERKQETTLEYLADRQGYFSRLSEVSPNFVRVDATRQPDLVAAEVTRVIEEFSNDIR